MKKYILGGVAVLLVVLLAGCAWVYFAATTETAPRLEEESLDALPGQVLGAMLTGEEVAVSQGQLNRMMAWLPAEKRELLHGVELTGENTAVVWCKTSLFGRTCHVRVEVALAYEPDTGVLRCTVGEIQVGRLAVPRVLAEKLLQEKLQGLEFSQGVLSVNVNDLTRQALGTDTAVVKDLRCTQGTLYLRPVSAGDLLGSLFGKNG